MTVTLEAPMNSKSSIPVSKPPSRLVVGATPDSDWVLRRRRGNRVRYQNTRTAAWDVWITLEPGDPLYREPMTVVETLQEDVEPETTPAIRIEDAGEVEMTIEQPDFSTMSRDRLRRIAAECRLEGRGSMSKSELVNALAHRWTYYNGEMTIVD